MKWVCEWDKAARIARVFPDAGKPHELEHDAWCWCFPRCEPVNRGVMWVHNEQTRQGEKVGSAA